MGLLVKLTLGCLSALLLHGAAWAQSAERGAMLYMRLPSGTRACVSCHGPEPGANPNNILRGADNPGAITKALSTVSAMGFLGSQLSEQDRADLAAFLGGVAALSDPALGLRIWPVTLESGAVSTLGSVQTVQLANVSTLAVAISNISGNDAALLLQHNCPATLAPQATCEVRTRMQFAGAGWSRAALRIDSPQLPRAFFAGASALGTSEPVSTLLLGDGTASFSLESPAGAMVRRKLVLSNPGPMPASVDALLLIGPQAAQFKVEQGCGTGTVLQAGTSCELDLSYQPNLLPRAQATLRVRSNQGHPQSLLLQGLGALAPVAPAPDALPADGGGCSTRPPGGRGVIDPMLWFMALAALMALYRKHRR